MCVKIWPGWAFSFSFPFDSYWDREKLLPAVKLVGEPHKTHKTAYEEGMCSSQLFSSLSFSSFLKMGSSRVRVFPGSKKKIRASSSSVSSHLIYAKNGWKIAKRCQHSGEIITNIGWVKVLKQKMTLFVKKVFFLSDFCLKWAIFSFLSFF